MTDADPFQEFIESASSELVAQGFPRMPARVLMALTATDDGKATSQELAEWVGASPAAISGAVRYLGLIGAVRNTTVPGTRRHVYSLGDVPWYAASFTRGDMYARIETAMRTPADKMPHDSAARARIQEFADFYAFLRERLPGLLEEWYDARKESGGADS